LALFVHLPRRHGPPCDGKVFGGKYGNGYLSCRNKSGPGWSAPGTVRIEGGSVGFQIGGSETDLIMLVMNARGAEKLLSSKFTLAGCGKTRKNPVKQVTEEMFWTSN
jgi:SH3 domain-containing YSC84-like protein 1